MLPFLLPLKVKYGDFELFSMLPKHHVTILNMIDNYVKLFLMIWSRNGKKWTSNPQVGGPSPPRRASNIKGFGVLLKPFFSFPCYPVTTPEAI